MCMKKAMYFTLGLIILSLITNAGISDKGFNSETPLYRATKLSAPTSGKKCFDESTRVLNIGLGFGYNYYSYAGGAGTTVRHIPAISISYEQPWTKRFGPGLMGVGAYIGFKASSWKYEYSDPFYGSDKYKDSHSDIIIASRAMYHWDGLNIEKAEVYGGILLGLRISTSKYTREYSGAAAVGNTNSTTSDVNVNVAYSIVAGARYYFKPTFGVYSELSYGISFLTIGVSLKI